MILLWWGHEVANGLDIYTYIWLWWGFRIYGDATWHYGPLWTDLDWGNIWGDWWFSRSRLFREETLAQEKRLGCRHDASLHGWHTRVNTSVGTIYDIFWFSWCKIYMYYILKSICIIKRNIGGLWLRPSPRCSKKVFDRLWIFKWNIHPQT